MTDAKNPHNRNDDVPEQLRIRREKRARLLEDGIDAYPVVVDRTTSITDLRNNYVVLREDEDVDTLPWGRKPRMRWLLRGA